MKSLEKILFLTVASGSIVLFCASFWDGYVSDQILNKMIIEAATGNIPNNLEIKKPQQFFVEDITEKYQVIMKDSQPFWGHFYSVKFNTGATYYFLLDPSIFNKHRIIFLGSDHEKTKV